MSIAPIEPIDQPELPKPSPPPRGRSLGLEALFGLAVAVVVAGLGAPVGLIWSRVAPRVELVQTPYGPYPIDGEPEGYFADDGWFVIIGAVAGILVAVAAWLILRRYRGAFILAGLVIGSAAASTIAAWLGNKIGYAHYLDLVQHAPVDTHIFRPAKVRAGNASLWLGVIPWVRGSLLIQALVAAVIYTCLAGFHGSPTLTYDPDPYAAGGDPDHPGHQYGDPAAGYPQPGYGPAPDGGQPSFGPPPWEGAPGGAQPGPDFQPAPGRPYGQPAYGPPAYGQVAYGPPAYGQVAEGSPGGGQPAVDPTANGQADDDPVPGRPDLSKPAPGAAPGPSPSAAAEPTPDQDREDWRTP